MAGLIHYTVEECYSYIAHQHKICWRTTESGMSVRILDFKVMSKKLTAKTLLLTVCVEEYLSAGGTYYRCALSTGLAGQALHRRVLYEGRGRLEAEKCYSNKVSDSIKTQEYKVKGGSKRDSEFALSQVKKPTKLQERVALLPRVGLPVDATFEIFSNGVLEPKRYDITDFVMDSDGLTFSCKVWWSSLRLSTGDSARLVVERFKTIAKEGRGLLRGAGSTFCGEVLLSEPKQPIHGSSYAHTGYRGRVVKTFKREEDIRFMSAFMLTKAVHRKRRALEL